MTKLESKQRVQQLGADGGEELEYQEFMDRFDGVILVSFGTTHMPNEQMIELMF